MEPDKTQVKSNCFKKGLVRKKIFPQTSIDLMECVGDSANNVADMQQSAASLIPYSGTLPSCVEKKQCGAPGALPAGANTTYDGAAAYYDWYDDVANTDGTFE